MERLFVGNKSLFNEVSKNLSNYMAPDGYEFKCQEYDRYLEILITHRSISKPLGYTPALKLRMTEVQHYEIKCTAVKTILYVGPFDPLGISGLLDRFYSICKKKYGLHKVLDVEDRVFTIVRNTFEMEKMYGGIVNNIPIYIDNIPLYPMRHSQPVCNAEKCEICRMSTLNVMYSSPREYWRNMSGREGYLPICPNCGNVKQFVLTRMN